MKNNKGAFGSILEEVTADSGYCSEKNLLYLKQNEISSYIKLQDHEKRKTRAYSEDISKYYNMRTGIFEENPNKDFLRPKIESIYQNKNILNKLQRQKAL